MKLTGYAISVRQPWAEAILLGYKPIENRSGGFSLKHRGRLYIHAGMVWSNRGQNDHRMRDAFQGRHGYAIRHEVAWHQRPMAPFVGGAILGYVDVVDIHYEMGGCCRPWGETEYVEGQGRSAKKRTGLVHIVMEDPHKFDRPIPFKGRLGIFQFEVDQ